MFNAKMLAAMTAIPLACSAGCSQKLETAYGQRSGPGATASINGTAVFAEMFESAGHRVSSWSSLSPRLDQADCVVWFPDDFQPPSLGVTKWFEHWLNAAPRRTLIYVGRDFDAAPWYWRKIQTTAPAGHEQAIADLRAEAEGAFQSARRSQQGTQRCRWFAVRYDAQTKPASNITGDFEWIHDIDPSQWEVEVNGRMSPGMDMEALLDSDESLIVGRLNVGQSQILAVTNGSFLLNAALVNHEHRKLARKLIDAIGSSGREVVFLESGEIHVDQPISPDPAFDPSQNPFAPSSDEDSIQPARQQNTENGPPIRRADPAPDERNGLDLLLVWPTNWILLHFALIGVLFCFWKMPIFGLPLAEDTTGSTDFGRHVDAVAALLRRTADRRYALSRVQRYQQIMKKVE